MREKKWRESVLGPSLESTLSSDGLGKREKKFIGNSSQLDVPLWRLKSMKGKKKRVGDDNNNNKRSMPTSLPLSQHTVYSKSITKNRYLSDVSNRSMLMLLSSPSASI